MLRAILSNPKDVESQQTQHSLQYSPQEIARAIQDLDQQIAANSTDPRLYYERGFLKYKSGQYLAAKEDFEQILKTINPNDDIAYFHIGLSYYGLYGSNQKNSEYLMQATKNISKAIELDRNGWLIWWREQRRNRDIKALENKIKEANAFLEKNQKSNARKKVYAAEAVCKTSLDRSYRTLCRQVNNLLKRV